MSLQTFSAEVNVVSTHVDITPTSLGVAMLAKSDVVPALHAQLHGKLQHVPHPVPGKAAAKFQPVVRRANIDVEDLLSAKGTLPSAIRITAEETDEKRDVDAAAVVFYADHLDVAQVEGRGEAGLVRYGVVGSRIEHGIHLASPYEMHVEHAGHMGSLLVHG